jgi:hypothetical protein
VLFHQLSPMSTKQHTLFVGHELGAFYRESLQVRQLEDARRTGAKGIPNLAHVCVRST